MSLFVDHVSLIDVEEWLLVEDYTRLRAEAKEAERRLERVKKVLIDLLPEVRDIRIGEAKWNALLDDSIERPFSPPRPPIEVKTPYGWVSISDLSLGYRTMIAWTVDLQAGSSHFIRKAQSPRGACRGPGRRGGPPSPSQVATRVADSPDGTLPRTQFVVTAHSPLVVQASENENIVVLRREGDHVVIDNDVETVRGWRVDQVLTSDCSG